MCCPYRQAVPGTWTCAAPYPFSHLPGTSLRSQCRGTRQPATNRFGMWTCILQPLKDSGPCRRSMGHPAAICCQTQRCSTHTLAVLTTSSIWVGCWAPTLEDPSASSPTGQAPCHRCPWRHTGRCSRQPSQSHGRPPASGGGGGMPSKPGRRCLTASSTRGSGAHSAPYPLLKLIEQTCVYRHDDVP